MIKPTFDKSLKELSSMKTGGNASVCYLPENESELIDDEGNKVIVRVIR